MYIDFPDPQIDTQSGGATDILYFLIGSVGVFGADEAYVGYHGFLHHAERIGRFGEDGRFVHVQHPDVHLPQNPSCQHKHCVHRTG